LWARVGGVYAAGIDNGQQQKQQNEATKTTTNKQTNKQIQSDESNTLSSEKENSAVKATEINQLVVWGRGLCMCVCHALLKNEKKMKSTETEKRGGAWWEEGCGGRLIVENHK
jgi:cytoskeletal protein RodZ